MYIHINVPEHTTCLWVSDKWFNILSWRLIIFFHFFLLCYTFQLFFKHKFFLIVERVETEWIWKTTKQKNKMKFSLVWMAQFCCFSGVICQGFGIEFNDKTRVAFDWKDYKTEDCWTLNLLIKYLMLIVKEILLNSLMKINKFSNENKHIDFPNQFSKKKGRKAAILFATLTFCFNLKKHLII